MQSFLSLWLNAGAQITHGGQVQRPRQKNDDWTTFSANLAHELTGDLRCHFLTQYTQQMSSRNPVQVER